MSLCEAVSFSSGESTSGIATFVVTTNDDTIIQQPTEESIPNAFSIGVIPTRLPDLMPLRYRERRAAKLVVFVARVMLSFQ